MATKLREVPLPAYGSDAAGWAEAQAAALRERRIDLLDWDNLAEEIADVSGRERDKLESALATLLMHLLKWDHQPSRRGASWAITVAEQRRRIARGLTENSSLRPRVPDMVDHSYASGRNAAAIELQVSPKLFPSICPYSFDEIMTRPIEWDGELA